MPNGNVGTLEEAVFIMKDTFEMWAREYRHLDLKPQQLRRIYDKQKREKVYKSELYQVAVDRQPEHGYGRAVIWHLSIKRLDKAPIMDWRDLQEIKNQIAGAETEAVQIFPAETRLVDTSNQYHLFAFLKLGDRKQPTVPLGWMQRAVTSNRPADGAYVRGAVNRLLLKDGGTDA